MARLDIRLKRAYDDADPRDGVRILVERLWPRGVTKAVARIDHWYKDAAPSPDLRKWYAHRPERWDEFQRRYRRELDQNQERVADLMEICLAHKVTFVFAARDVMHNSAVVLKNHLESY